MSQDHVSFKQTSSTFPLTSQAQANVLQAITPQTRGPVHTRSYLYSLLRTSNSPGNLNVKTQCTGTLRIFWVPSDNCYVKHCTSVEDEVFKTVRCKNNEAILIFVLKVPSILEKDLPLPECKYSVVFSIYTLFFSEPCSSVYSTSISGELWVSPEVTSCSFSFTQ